MTENTALNEVSQSTVSTPAAAPAPQISMNDYLHKNEATRIVQERTREVATKAEREGYERAQREYAEKQNSQTYSQPQQTFNNAGGGMQGPSEERIRQMIAEQQQMSQQQGAWQNTVETFVSRVQAAKEQYPELEKSLVDLGIQDYPEIVRMANSIDNTAEVLKDMADNPEKLFMIAAMAESGKKSLAFHKMQQLSNSIKTNKSALSTPSALEPLSQLKASTIGADSGSMTQADWGKIYTA